jgi:integrase
MREFGKLTAAQIRSAKLPKLAGDGGGLYLHTGPSGSRSWVLRYKVDGSAHEHGLGSLRDVGLAEARERARAARRELLDGNDPILAKRAKKALARLVRTIKHSVDEYIRAHRAEWSAKTADSWESLFRDYVFPIVGDDCRVDAVDTDMVVRVLAPVWTVKIETARRVRGRLEAVLDFAKVSGFRSGENPARWKGHLDHLLADQARVAKVEHHAAMDWRDLPNFLKELRRQATIAALALEFTVLCAVRSGESRAAEWSEFDGNVWTIPASRTKTKTELKVPLSARAIEIIDAQREVGLSERFVFPGRRADRPLADGAMLDALRKIDGTAVVHGFRASFRTWAAENGHPRTVAEMALGHVVGSQVERAYQRSDVLDRRRALMKAWSGHCAGGDGNVVKLRA